VGSQINPIKPVIFPTWSQCSCRQRLKDAPIFIREVSPRWPAQQACEVWKHKKERGLKALTEFLGRMGCWGILGGFSIFHPQIWLWKHETMGKQCVINLAITLGKLVEKCKSDGMRLGQVIAAPRKCVLMTCLEVWEVRYFRPDSCPLVQQSESCLMMAKTNCLQIMFYVVLVTKEDYQRAGISVCGHHICT
jgi:hypothetical protein